MKTFLTVLAVILLSVPGNQTATARQSSSNAKAGTKSVSKPGRNSPPKSGLKPTPKSGRPLALKIGLAKHDFLVSEPVFATVSLLNTGDSRVAVRRLYLPYSYLRITVRDSHGK